MVSLASTGSRDLSKRQSSKYPAVGHPNKRSEFYDKEFPPGRSSLISNWNKSRNADTMASVTWRKFREVFANREYCIIGDSIEPGKLKIGPLSHSYLYSAIAILSERPDLITQLHDQSSSCDRGMFVVNINEDGLWKSIILDDYIPCQSNGSMLFLRSFNQEIWPCLLEKACAKCYRSYENVEDGIAAEAIRDFTGAPIELLTLQDNEDFWKKLLNYFKAGSDCNLLSLQEL